MTRGVVCAPNVEEKEKKTIKNSYISTVITMCFIFPCLCFSNRHVLASDSSPYLSLFLSLSLSISPLYQKLTAVSLVVPVLVFVIFST